MRAQSLTQRCLAAFPSRTPGVAVNLSCSLEALSGFPSGAISANHIAKRDPLVLRKPAVVDFARNDANSVERSAWFGPGDRMLGNSIPYGDPDSALKNTFSSWRA